jgi:hypothetical protein
MNYLKKKFEPRFRVYPIPEVATLTAYSGVNIIPKFFTPERHLTFTVKKIPYKNHQKIP